MVVRNETFNTEIIESKIILDPTFITILGVQGVVAYSICSHWHQHFLAFDLWPFVWIVGVGGSEKEKRDIGLCSALLSQQARASGSGWAGWASAHPIFWDYNRPVNPFFHYRHSFSCPLLMLFFETFSCKRRSDSVLNGQMRVLK